MIAALPALMIGLLVVTAWIGTVVDVATTPRLLVRNLPKEAWLFYVLLFPVVGGVVWLVLGRPASVERSLMREISEIQAPTGSFAGPEDTPEWANYVRTIGRPLP